jgi:hypothetical protein
MTLADERPPPDWVVKDGALNPGLDLTGLRLPVRAIGRTQLNGITTITPSVRYLSIYAWIVNSYLNARLPSQWGDFKRFAQGVESAVALGNVLNDPSVKGVIGKTGAAKSLDDSDDPVQLKTFVKQPAVNIYSNTSVELILTHSSGSPVPGLTKERGLPLARAVNSHFSATKLGSQFADGRFLDTAFRSDLRDFGAVSHINEPSADEREFLLASLLPTDPLNSTEVERVRTYAYILFLASLLDRCPEESDFFTHVRGSNQLPPNELIPALDGWLCYSVRDLLAVVHERVLEELVRTLGQVASDSGSATEVAVIERLVGDITEHETMLNSLGLATDRSDIVGTPFRTFYESIREATTLNRVATRGLVRWDGDLNEWTLMNRANNAAAGALVLLPIAWVMATLRAEEWPGELPFEGDQLLGQTRFGLQHTIIPQIKRFIDDEWTLGEVMFELARRTIGQHLRVSWSRIAVDPTRDVALLVTDGHRWWSRNAEKHVSGYEAGRTGSRYTQVIGWLKQLRLVSDDGLLPDGRSMLDRCLSTLRS